MTGMVQQGGPGRMGAISVDEKRLRPIVVQGHLGQPAFAGYKFVFSQSHFEA